MLSMGRFFAPSSSITFTDSQSMPLRIAIIGGGIGGLTLAVALSKLSFDNTAIEIDIYESAPRLTQIGAGITFWPRAWKILERIGVADELLTHLAPGQHVPDEIPRLAFQFRKSDIKDNGIPIRDLVFAGSPLSFHRAVVQEVLLNHLSPAIRCHLSSRLVSYSTVTSPHSHPETEHIRLIFDDGKSVTCDFLVGADGIKSTIRREFVRSGASPSNERPYSTLNIVKEIADPIWSGTIAYRCSLDSAVLAQKMPGHRALTTHVVYCGKNQHIIAYPILQGRVVNVAAYVSDLSKEGAEWNGPPFEDVTKEEVIPWFDSWEEEVRLLIHNAEKPSRWAIHAIEPLKSYASTTGNVLLLGDAAHAMTPHQGNGAGQAIEDAYILAALISKGISSTQLTTISKISQVYDTIRRPAANLVHSLSRMHGLLYEFNVPEVHGDDATQYSERLEKLGEAIIEDWRYAWETTAEEDRERALSMLD